MLQCRRDTPEIINCHPPFLSAVRRAGKWLLFPPVSSLIPRRLPQLVKFTFSALSFGFYLESGDGESTSVNVWFSVRSSICMRTDELLSVGCWEMEAGSWCSNRVVRRLCVHTETYGALSWRQETSSPLEHEHVMLVINVTLICMRVCVGEFYIDKQTHIQKKCILVNCSPRDSLWQHNMAAQLNLLAVVTHS